MATINLTQLLGTDNISMTRPVINQNFTTVQNAINNLELYLNTTPAGASLGIGNIQINLGANNINTTLFSCAATGIFQGSLTINQILSVVGVSSFTGTVSLENGLNLNGTGATAVFNIGQLSNPVNVNHRGGMFLDQQYVTEVPIVASTETSVGTNIFQLDVTNKKVIYLDYSAYTGALTDADQIQLIGTGVNGQRLFIRISSAPVSGGTFSFIASGVFSTEYLVDIEFTGVTDSELKRQWIEIIYKSGSWVVVNSHPNVVGI